MTEIVIALLIIVGGISAVIGSVGLVRFPDVLMRMHASTKIGTLACGMIIVAAALHFGSSDITIRAIAIILFLLLTAPIAAHMIGRAAVATGVKILRMGPKQQDSEMAPTKSGEND